MKVPVLTNQDYTIGWITALQIELAAAKGMLDEIHHTALPQDAADTNNYSMGRLGPHNIVIACLPSMGNNAAAFAAANMLRSFPNVRIGLMVGIGGGAPDYQGEDIRLGDVVVSTPDGAHGGVLQFDFGTTIQTGDGQEFVPKGYLNRPPSSLLTAVRTLQANAEMEGYAYGQYYEDMIKRYPAMGTTYKRPTIDNLYRGDYVHPGGKADCSECSDTQLVQRDVRTTSIVHYGLVGSSNEVVRNAKMRDKWNTDQGIMCFEMEAAGLMNDFPCLVIRGICDYCDTHKNKNWQRYASAQAAAFAKEVLMNISPVHIESTPKPSWILEALDSQLDEHHITQNAIKELRDKLDDTTEDDMQCLAKIKATDPRIDKERIESTKGGLLANSYMWILRAEEFTAWHEHQDKNLLWIRGDPGKGKTMLLCGIITELSKENHFLSYFFCQATQNQLNSAVSALRGIIFLLADQRPALIQYIKKHTDKSTKSVFEDYNAWFTLSAILKDCLEDELTQDVTIVVDALDECADGREKLIALIVSCSKTYTARWVISSRNWPEIEKDLKLSNEKTNISLELNAASVSAAVQSYIDYRVEQLTTRQEYDEETRSEVTHYLTQHARDTFLWVALVCSHLEEVSSWETISALQSFPPGLNELYKRMLQRILSSRHSLLLVQILALSMMVYRPLRISEMLVLLDTDATLPRSPGFIKELVGLCGSFLTIKDLHIELIHQSAKDFLLAEGASSIFVHGQEPIHKQIYVKSLKKLQITLKRDIYSLKDPSIAIGSVVKPTPDPLEDLEYSCIYWIDHLMERQDDDSESQLSIENVRLLDDFMREQFIYWLEASSLIGGISTIALSISKLEKLISHSMLDGKLSTEPAKDKQHTQVVDLIQDILQFVRYFQYPLESFPLQVYVSGLLFSPICSVVKHIFAHEMPKWVDVKRGLHKNWPIGVTLGYKVEGSDGLQFSPKNDQIAAVIETDRPVILGWDVITGRQTFNIPYGERFGGNAPTWRFSFLGDDKLVSCEADYREIKLWILPKGQLQQTIALQLPDNFSWKAGVRESATDGRFDTFDTKTYTYEYNEGVFSHDGLLFARHSMWNSLEVYDTLLGTLKFHVECQWDWTQSLAVSYNKLYVISCNGDDSKVWDIQKGSLLQTFSKHTTCRTVPMFSPTTNLVALVNEDVLVWDWSQNSPVYSFNEFLLKSPARNRRRAAAFEPLTGRLIVSSPTALLDVDPNEKTPGHLVRRFRSDIQTVACSFDGRYTAVGDSTAIDIWKSCSIPKDQSASLAPFEPKFSNLYLCGDVLISFGIDKSHEIHISSVNNDAISNTISYVGFLAQLSEISPNRCFAVFADEDGPVEVWDLVKQVRLTSFVAGTEENRIRGITWDPQSKFITIVTSNQDDLILWDATTGVEVKRWAPPQLPELSNTYELCWSPNSTYLAMSDDISIDIWSTNNSTWRKLVTNETDSLHSHNMIFSPDETLLTAVDWDNGLRVWNVDTMELIIEVLSAEIPCSLAMSNEWLRIDEAWYKLPTDRKPVHDPERYDTHHVNIQLDDLKWIRFGSKDMIWIPGEYLPKDPQISERYWDIDGDRVAIGLTHDILVLDVSWDKWAAESGEHGFTPATKQLDKKDKQGWSLPSRSKSTGEATGT